MRALAAIGALGFAYLAIIPAGLVASMIESACAGEGCASAPLSKLTFTALYGACLLAVVGCALLFAHHALRGSLATQRRLGLGLRLTAVVVSVTLLALFAAAFPLGAALALGGAAITLAVLAWLARERGGLPPASSNGQATNGTGPHPRL